MRQTIVVVSLMLLLAGAAGGEAQKRTEAKPIPELSSYTFDAPAPTMFSIVGPKTTVTIYADGRVEWDKGSAPEAANEFWRELSKLTPTFMPTERIQAVEALELALSHLRLSTEAYPMMGVFPVYHTPCPACDLKAKAAEIEKRDTDIKAIIESLDRLKKTKEQQ